MTVSKHTLMAILSSAAILALVGVLVNRQAPSAPEIFVDPPTPTTSKGESADAAFRLSGPQLPDMRSQPQANFNEVATETVAPSESIPTFGTGPLSPPPLESAVVRQVAKADIPAEIQARLAARQREIMDSMSPEEREAFGKSSVISVERTGLIRPTGQDRFINATQSSTPPPEAAARLLEAKAAAAARADDPR